MMKTVSGPFSQKQDPHRVSPVDRPGLDLLEKDEVKTKRPSMWNIVFYNDDYTPMDFVEFVLKTIFHMSTLDALVLTLAGMSRFLHSRSAALGATPLLARVPTKVSSPSNLRRLLVVYQ